MVFLREHNDSVLTSDTSSMYVFLRTTRYSYKYECNDCRETALALEYIILKSYYRHELRSS